MLKQFQEQHSLLNTRLNIAQPLAIRSGMPVMMQMCMMMCRMVVHKRKSERS